MQTKERAGIERAVLATVFIKDSFPPGMLKKFITLVSEQHTYLSVFRSMADPLDIQLYESKMQASVVKEAENFRRIAMDKSISGGFGIDPAVWFQKQTGKINILKQVEDEIALGVLTKSDALSKTADEVLIYSTLATIIILTIAIFLAYVITTVLIRQITTLNNAIAKVADGDLTTTVDLDGKDELSNSMKLINQMIYVLNDTLTEVIRASEKVSTASLEFEKSSERMSYGAMEQTSSIEEISTAMEEMATTIQKNATNLSLIHI